MTALAFNQVTGSRHTVDTDVAPMKWYEKFSPLLFAARWYYSWTMYNRGMKPIPRDEPQYRTGEKAWRMLLVGNGPTHGWGVLTHNLALTGQISRALARNANVHVDVDYVGEELMSTETAINWLGKRDMGVYDMMVLVLSMNDAARFTDPQAYKQSVIELLNRMRQDRRDGVKTLVVGIQPINSVVGYQNALGKFVQHHADRLNAIMRESVETNGDFFMDLSAPELEPDRPLGSPTTYAVWAEKIAQHAAPILPAGEPGSLTVDEKIDWIWKPSSEILNFDLENQEHADKLHEIAERARKRFFGQFSGVSLINDGVQYHPAAAGLNPSSVPLELSYCNVAIQQDEPLVVGNGWSDARFKDNPYLAQLNLPFYAGMAMRDRQGEVIGSFCVMSAIPRPAATFPVEELKKYAAEAQEELWRIEDETNARPQ